MLEAKNIFLKKCPNIEILFFMISNSDFSMFFFCFYRHRLVLEIPFPDSRNTVLKIFISRPPANTTPPLHLDTSYVEGTSRLHLDQHIYPPLL